MLKTAQETILLKELLTIKSGLENQEVLSPNKVHMITGSKPLKRCNDKKILTGRSG